MIKVRRPPRQRQPGPRRPGSQEHAEAKPASQGVVAGAAPPHPGPVAAPLTLHTLCWHTVVMGRNTSSWQQMHWKASSTLLRNF